MDEFEDFPIENDHYEMGDNTQFNDEGSDNSVYTEPSQNPLAEFIAGQLGIEDYQITTGDVNNPLVVDIREMNDRQLNALWKELNTPQESFRVEEDEKRIVELLREGKLNELYDELGRELGVSKNSEMVDTRYTDDQIAFWKISSEFPQLSEDEVIEEIEHLKNSSTYSTKLKKYREDWNTQINSYKEAEESNKKQQVYNEISQASVQLKQMIDTVDNHYGFDVSDEVKREVMEDLTTIDNRTGTTAFIKNYVDNPEGLLEAAIAIKNMPRIAEYVTSLQNEIAKLKQSRSYIPQNTSKNNNTQNIQSKNRHINFFNELEEM